MDRTAIISAVALLTVCLLLAGCVQRAPFQTVEGACGHLVNNPEQYQDCAESVSAGNQAREEAWQAAGMRDQPPPSEVPTFAPDPSIYTLQTKPSAPPSPTPLPNLGSVYEPAPPPKPSLTGPNAPAFVGQVPGGPEVYVVPAN